MSNSPLSLQPLEQEQARESDALNQKTPNLVDPPPKSDPETIPPPGSEEEVEETEERETPAISSGMSLNIDPHLSHSDTTLTSPSGDTSNRRGVVKRKGKAKAHNKKRQAIIDEKISILKKKLKPIAFIPTRLIDFANHEKLLKKLGLWDFVHIDFDRKIRVDLIAQLVGSYNPKSRGSYVNNYRVMVNRADLARAFKLPLKKERANASVVDVDLDVEVLSEESIGFIVDFMSEWVLLHEDTWMMPNEVSDWLKLVKDGHPEKVDWAGLLWLMVEKELKQGAHLRDCYYAPHLQHIIKFQRESVMEIGMDFPLAEELGVDGEVKEEENDINVENDANVENVNDVGSIATPREENVNDVGSVATPKEENVNDVGSIATPREENVNDVGSVATPKEENVNDVGSVATPSEGNVNDVGSVATPREENVNDAGSVATPREEIVKDAGSVATPREENVNDVGPVATPREENVNDVGSTAIPREEDPIVGGPSTKLTLGQEEDGENEDGMKDVEMIVAEKSKESDDEVGEEEKQGEEEEGGQWLLNGKNDLGVHILQRCGVQNNEGFSSLNFRKDEEEEEMDGQEDREEEMVDGEEDEEETGNDFQVYPNDGALEGDGFTGNLLQGNHMGFSSQHQLHDPSSMDVRGDMQQISSAPSFFNTSGKRILEHDNDISHHSIDDSNKRLRINDSWDNKSLDFGMFMDQIAQMAERAKVLYTEKEHTMAQSSMNEQLLIGELNKRDSMIEHMHKTRVEEAQKKDREIFRLERELYFMASVVDGYKKALKDVQKSFAEYRERANLAEESTYKDTGEGGLMLTAPELEKLRKKREEEYKMKCLLLEKNISEVEEDLDDKFSLFLENVNRLDKRLSGLEADGKELISLYAKRKIPPTEEKVAEVNMAEVSEPLPNPESEENVAEVYEPLPNPEIEDKVPEVSKSPQIPESEAKSAGSSEPLQNAETD